MNRADFLKTLLGGVAVTVVSPRLLGQDNAKPSSSEPVVLDESHMEYVAERDASTVGAYFLTQGPADSRKIAITFDDGPTPGVTETVLKALDERKIKGTFFMIGRRVDECPDLAQRVALSGHEIGNHSYTHPKLSALSTSRVQDELRRTQDVIGEVCGAAPIWFRPPYGAFRKNQGDLAKAQNLGVVLWSVDPRDWAKPGPRVIETRVNASTRGGSIILLHDLHRQTAEATPRILDDLIDKGYEFTSLSDILVLPTSGSKAKA